MPDRAFKQVPLQTKQRRRREHVVKIGGATVEEVRGERLAIRPLAHGTVGKLGRTANMDGGVVILAEHVPLLRRGRDRLLRNSFATAS